MTHVARPLPRLQLFIGKEQPSPEKIQPIVNRPDWMKPSGGLWTSSWNAEDYTSAWTEWCGDENFSDIYGLSWWLLVPRPESRIYQIDSLDDLERCLHSPYGYQASYLEHMKRSLGRGYDKRFIDFERMAHDFDGLHLTHQGNEETHLSVPNDLNGWDVESTLWFRWCFSAVRQIPTPTRPHTESETVA